MKNKKLLVLLLPLMAYGCSSNKFNPEAFKEARANGQMVNEGYNRSMDYVNAWLERADSASGLIPENFRNSKGSDTWQAHNNAADNYAFMVLTTYLLDENLYKGRMLDMLRTEKKLTSRINSLPDSYSFSKQDFVRDTVDRNWIIFGASEYCKDGLLPLTEYIGHSPWQDRMLEMLDDLHVEFHALKALEQLGSNKATGEEVNGEMLQTLSRVYWLTGDRKYLDWAIKIGDYYLLGERDLTQVDYLRLRDHGCEIIGGLSELYVALHFADLEKKETYKAPFYQLLDLILKKGRNEHGLFYNAFNPQSGAVVDQAISDTWGYIYDAYYSVYLVDQHGPYREAIETALSHLNDHYRNYPWEGQSHDGYADAIEGGINLLNRIAMPSLAQWIDSETKVMFGMQQENGLIGGWHGDGNFARTAIMFCLWKTQGTYCQPWRRDLKLGATHEEGKLRLAISAKQDWEGKLKFDVPRHQVNLNLPLDYPRINQFPEWFTVSEDKEYALNINGERTTRSGRQLIDGIPLEVKGNQPLYIQLN